MSENRIKDDQQLAHAGHQGNVGVCLLQSCWITVLRLLAAKTAI
jgi:hypothetical protein